MTKERAATIRSFSRANPSFTYKRWANCSKKPMNEFPTLDRMQRWLSNICLLYTYLLQLWLALDFMQRLRLFWDIAADLSLSGFGTHTKHLLTYVKYVNCRSMSWHVLSICTVRACVDRLENVYCRSMCWHVWRMCSVGACVDMCGVCVLWSMFTVGACVDMCWVGVL